MESPALAIDAAAKTVMVGRNKAMRLLCGVIFTRGQVVLEGNIGAGLGALFWLRSTTSPVTVTGESKAPSTLCRAIQSFTRMLMQMEKRR